MNSGNIVALAICIPLAAACLYIQRRAWVAIWIGLRGIPHLFAAISRDDLDGAFKGLEDAIRYIDGKDQA